MRELTTILNDFGFSKKETLFYLSLLELGEAQITDIAKKIGLPRTSCYEIIKSLEKRHVISHYKKRDRKVYLAEDPARVSAFFENRNNALIAMIPQLRARYAGTKGKPSVRFYDGENGIGSILNEVISEKRNFYAITCIDDAMRLLEGDFTEFIEERRRRNLHVKLLTRKSDGAIRLKQTDDDELRETRFIPSNYKFETANFIFGEKCAIISLDKQNPFGLVIEDPLIASTFRMFFDIMWESAQK